MTKTKLNIPELIASLCFYGETKLMLSRIDSIYAENALLHLFNQTTAAKASKKEVEDIQQILTPLIEYAIKEKIFTDEKIINFETYLLGFVTPPPGEVLATFDNIAANKGIESATQYLYELSQNSSYIRTKDIAKNIKWTAPGNMGDLTITINLSKPEKDNKQVALAKKAKQDNYPKCPLCVENLGFFGNADGTARQTLRIVPINLDGEEWYFQFSPYVYYDNHCIAFSAEHSPMTITDKTITRLFDFTENFPHYFIGSNADLPIVGGSILTHDHYQGGKKVMPMMSRPPRKRFKANGFPDVLVSVTDWYNSVIKLESKNRKSLENLASKIISHWKNYSDDAAEILAFTDKTPHNTVTPIALLEKELYTLYIILRNNRTDEKRPHGIFHAREEVHNIKKEGIGIIEVMGIFILPGRLFSETQSIIDILTGKEKLDFKELSKEENPLSKHLSMIAQLATDLGTNLPIEEAEQAIVKHINSSCIKILETTAVFKNTEQGQECFKKFLDGVGIDEM